MTNAKPEHFLAKYQDEPYLQIAAQLRQAANFDDPEWTRGRNAQTKAAQAVDPGSPEAVQFCAQGLLLRIARRTPEPGFAALTAAVREVLPAPYTALYAWNDQQERTPQQVRELFLKAAQRQERIQRQLQENQERLEGIPALKEAVCRDWSRQTAPPVLR